jgi:hypothetical protein
MNDKYWCYCEEYKTEGSDVVEGRIMCVGPCEEASLLAQGISSEFIWGPFPTKRDAEEFAGRVEDLGFEGQA